MSHKFIQAFVKTNFSLSRTIAKVLPTHLRADGRTSFQALALESLQYPGLTVYDFGGGSRPLLTDEVKAQFGHKLIGLDIESSQLEKAPRGLYDETVVCDLSAYSGKGDADLVICQSVLEHVKGVPEALLSISSILKPGGKALLFLPCRNAVFARLNLALPQATKMRLLTVVYPEKGLGHYGFPAFYEKCTPGHFRRMLADANLTCSKIVCFWHSSYFMAFTPVWLIWKFYQAIA